MITDNFETKDDLKFRIALTCIRMFYIKCFNAGSISLLELVEVMRDEFEDLFFQFMNWPDDKANVFKDKIESVFKQNDASKLMTVINTWREMKFDA